MDSELVFQAQEDQRMTKISYKKENRPLINNYVSNQPVVSSEVTPGQTVLFYRDSNGCLFKGKVTFFDQENRQYVIDNGKAKKRGNEVRYSEGHGEA